MHVLIGGDSTDGGFMHFNVLRHLLQNQGTEILNAFFQKFFLKFHEAGHYLHDSFISLIYTSNNPLGATQLFLEIGLCGIRIFGLVGHQTAVVRTNS